LLVEVAARPAGKGTVGMVIGSAVLGFFLALTISGLGG
jgi:hypothetical protein